MPEKNKGFVHVFLLVLIVAAIAAVGVYFYWNELTGTESSSSTASQSAEAGLGAEVYEKSQSTSGEAVPQTNPFEAKINPFE